MIRARSIAASLALAVLAAGCGQKGDLRLPAAKTQATAPGSASAPATPPASK